jgi:protocatechuate 3,4-dioxygenase beta subunit
MSGQPPFLTRRAFGGVLLGGAAVAASSRALGQGRILRTPASDEGPFYPVDTARESDADMVWLRGRPARALGEVIQLSGRVLDARGNPVSGARIDLWQANAAGRYDHPADVATAPLDPNFQSFAIIRSDAQGAWRVTTIRPGGYDSPIGHRTPHIHVAVPRPDQRLVAQLYFPEHRRTNVTDQLYRSLGAAAPRSVARRVAAGRYEWDIVLS